MSQIRSLALGEKLRLFAVFLLFDQLNRQNASPGSYLFFLVNFDHCPGYLINYHFHEDNDEDVNDCISTAIAQVMQDTCLEFKQNPQAHNAILFLESSRCGWQQENSTVHLNSDCLNQDNCTQFVHHALSSPQQQHPTTVVRHLNMKFNCTDKCTILCENGGSVDQRTCTCKCSYGFLVPTASN
uniref:Peptidase M12A domain-containing protein n=1 Tax=Ditylenchus dipsaci TaxID=166011 RepID=A0A915D9W7_9BILA